MKQRDRTQPAWPRQLDAEGIDAVEKTLIRRCDEGAAVMSQVDSSLDDLVQQLDRLMSGGKRLRAAFCLWGARAASGELPAGVVEAAAALEMFHLAALVHDDVMDRSDQRRGGPTVHRVFHDLHTRQAYRGDARLFGDGVAVLLGDLCLTWSDDLLSRALDDAPTDRRPAAREVWELMRSQVIAGQHLDLLAQARHDTSTDASAKVLRYKSAGYSVEQPLRLGAALAGASDQLLTGLGELGVLAGTAFQLRDDVLGVFGDSGTTGKPVGDDVREGKRTLLVAWAEERATSAQLRVLAEHFGAADLDSWGLEAVRTVLRDTGALDRVEAEIADLTDQVHRRLDQLPADDDACAALGALSEACAWRSV